MAGAAGPEALSDLEERERARWLAEMVAILKDARLPVVELAAGSLDPDAVLRRAAGGRRARTLRQRVRDWKRARAWLDATGFTGFPSGRDGVGAFLDYLEDRASEPCARTVPGSAFLALSFFEKAGGCERTLASPRRHWF